MGYIRHHSIVVTSCNKEFINEAREKAISIFSESLDTGLTSEIVESSINGYYSFFIAPDGSKEGCSESEMGNICRKLFIAWVKSKAYEDGSNALAYAELYYGDDEGDAEIVNYN